MVRIALLSFVVAIAGCVSTGTDGPVKIGDDLYMVGGLGGAFDHSGSVVKAKFFKQASEHCVSMGREMLPVASKGQDAFMSNWASAEVQYRCVKK